MLPANMTSSSSAQSTPCDAVWAPITVRHMHNAMFCNFGGTRENWNGCYLQVSHLLFRRDLGLALVVLHLCSVIRLDLHSRRNQNIAHVVHLGLLWTHSLTELSVG